MLRHLLFSALLVVNILLGAPAIARDSSYTFTTIDFPGHTGNTFPGGINDRGQIVGTYSSNDKRSHGFLYDRGAFTTLDVPFPGAFWTEAYGINSRGQIVGMYVDDSGGHGFIFDKGIFTPLDAPFPGVTYTGAFGINERGQIVGRYTVSNEGNHGFLYSHGEFSIIDVPFPEAVSTSLSGINDKGQIVGIYWTENRSYFSAFLYEAGVFSTIEVPFPNASFFDISTGGINSRGQIAGGYFDTAGHGYLWHHHRGEFVTIDVPLTLVYQVLHGQWASGINSRGEVIGLYDDNLGPHIYLATPDNAVDMFGVVTELVSINRTGTDSGRAPDLTEYHGSFDPVVSANGRFVAFRSTATDLVKSSTNGLGDVFVRDLETGTTTLVTVNRTGTGSSNGTMFFPRGHLLPIRISADGRFVAFVSDATDLVTTELIRRPNLFVRDLQMGTTTLVNVNHAGTESGNAEVSEFNISADGRFVVFESFASDLVAKDTNGGFDVFVRDLQAKRTTLVSVNRSGTDSGNGLASEPAISADGRFVVFQSFASDLVANDTNGGRDVFVRDLRTGRTSLVSVNHTGTGSGNNSSGLPVFSSNGRFVAFRSAASDLVANDSDGVQDVFVRDLKTGTTILVGADDIHNLNDITNYMLSADGRFMSFVSNASNRVANDTNGRPDVFVRDLQTGTTSLVSVNHTGTGTGNAISHDQMMSADGRFVAFLSSASDLVTSDTNGYVNVFVRDLQTGTTTMIDVNRAGTGTANGPVGFPITRESDLSSFRTYVLSADGRFVAFGSYASDLVTTDTNGQVDVFVRPVR